MRYFDPTVTEKPNWTEFSRIAGWEPDAVPDARELFFQNLEPLLGLPLLIRELAPGCIEKLAVVGCGLLLLVQRVVGGCP